MAQQKINLGTSGNDGSGDAIRVAFSKVNDNFAELYGTTGEANGSQRGAKQSTTRYANNLEYQNKQPRKRY